ncbi:hypothetical protein HETIRDRAFT_437197 [Heterobasidion irregulare TC 32-1]|uniref:Uncharacterized protein n=1 Tax=Heterobasidion irregulare (strain TC 32-1) TaxID=747525 RepID=W4JRR0_HETIT|nr:uncharacterized protein HETIRDRAFT_437197 [Heterobasidion irregulare TC 32-1]ETW75561.1 hypothetical protein HETIRDRAFT_437197 [Heterobasidion irregulare TC 32-1]
MADGVSIRFMAKIISNRGVGASATLTSTRVGRTMSDVTDSLKDTPRTMALILRVLSSISAHCQFTVLLSDFVRVPHLLAPPAYPLGRIGTGEVKAWCSGCTRHTKSLACVLDVLLSLRLVHCSAPCACGSTGWRYRVCLGISILFCINTRAGNCDDHQGCSALLCIDHDKIAVKKHNKRRQDWGETRYGTKLIRLPCK